MIQKPNDMDTQLRNRIKQNLKNSLLKYVNNFSCTNIQPLDLLIPKERKIRSIVGGLETSIGTTVWEPIAKTLAETNGFEIIEDKILKPSPFPLELQAELSNVISLRESRSTWIPANECLERMRVISRKINKSGIKYVAPPAGTGVDIFLKKSQVEYAFDTKTVQPNLGSIKSFNKQILEWYAYRVCKNDEVKIECKIAYPYNPYFSDFWSHTPHNRGVLEPRVDALVENEFWDFISGMHNTYKQIASIFEELTSEGFGNELSNLMSRL